MTDLRSAVGLNDHPTLSFTLPSKIYHSNLGKVSLLANKVALIKMIMTLVAQHRKFSNEIFFICCFTVPRDISLHD